MRREYKDKLIDSIAEQLKEYPHFYVADISELNAEQTAELRRTCFEKEVELKVVKNTLFEKALEKVNGDYADDIKTVLKGSTSIMFSHINKAPAVIIDEFRNKKKYEKPILKAAYVEESVYVGDEHLATLKAIKSKEELIGDVIGLLQSPAQNVISALQAAAGGKVAGLVKALEEKSA